MKGWEALYRDSEARLDAATRWLFSHGPYARTRQRLARRLWAQVVAAEADPAGSAVGTKRALHILENWLPLEAEVGLGTHLDGLVAATHVPKTSGTWLHAAMDRAAGTAPHARSSASELVDELTGPASSRSRALGKVASHRPAVTTRHVPAALGFEQWIFEPTARQLVDVDAFYSWGVSRRTPQRIWLRRIADDLGRPHFTAEDGLFLRSVGLGLGDAPSPARSIMLDPVTAYYDATQPSGLHLRLNSSRELCEEQRTRANLCVAEIVGRRLSKYNHAPDTRYRYGRRGTPSILLVDQRRFDASVRYGLASELSFDKMLRFAIEQRPDCQLLLKRHPDAISGGAGSYFADARLRRLGLPSTRTTLIDEDVSPHTLFDQVEEVFVVTSGLGFEALLRGLKVHCFGAPFYAGWGLTDDHAPVPPRSRSRTALDLFHATAVESTLYCAPDLESTVPIEDAIDHFTHLAARPPR